MIMKQWCIPRNWRSNICPNNLENTESCDLLILTLYSKLISGYFNIYFALPNYVPKLCLNAYNLANNISLSRDESSYYSEFPHNMSMSAGKKDLQLMCSRTI
uniref:Uncharacterized protein n=1 Tax=Micrurus spixii TaxID=129469 RepID=A0A2D4LZP6_9SAUR